MRKLAKNSVAQRWLVASLDEIADMEEEVALKRLPPFQKAHDLKRTETKRNNMTKAESMQKMGLYKVIGSRAGGYAEIFNTDEVGISLHQPSGAGPRAYFFKGEETVSYGEKLGDSTWTKRILALMARACASNDNDEMTQLKVYRRRDKTHAKKWPLCLRCDSLCFTPRHGGVGERRILLLPTAKICK